MSATTMESLQAVVFDDGGDELRAEVYPGGRIYLTASQSECTATVGPFSRETIEAVMDLAGGAR